MGWQKHVLMVIWLGLLHSPSLHATPPVSAPVVVDSFFNDFCVTCHAGTEPSGGMAFDHLKWDDLPQNTAAWERIVRRIQSRQMPPAGEPRPNEATYQRFEQSLTDRLDQLAQANPRPGRTDTFRRLNRTEYQNAIRDLFGINIDATTMLPTDESSLGFDNITVTGLSPSLLNRYITAAQKISRLAVGRTGRSPEGETVRIRGDITQDDVRVPGLPLGTRGGTVLRWNFPVKGEYQAQIRLMRDRNDELEGLKGKHQLEVLLDRKTIQTFTIERPDKGRDDHEVDANLVARFYADAGEHELGVTFVQQGSSLQETDRQPLNVHFNFYRHPRLAPAVYQVSLTGPFGESSTGESESRKRIFHCKPESPDDERTCAEKILRPILRSAYRRPIEEVDLATPMHFFDQGRDETGQFDGGIEQAIAAILVNPQFLFRIERDPVLQSPRTDAMKLESYRLSDIELASRLSFFLWSSIPDEPLLQVAEQGILHQPQVLKAQVQRMLQDPRSSALVTNFANQWLYLRNLDAVTPDARLFPDFDHNLRDAFRQETEHLFQEMLREDKSVMLLIQSDHTYLNERLAKHYHIPHVHGSHFRRVELAPSDHRGGILRHGSILSVTSYATRTSPVLRGKWILENVLGTPPPPPPANVAALDDNTVAAGLPVRQRLSAHRANAACAVCHNLIDPAGFALENFDAVGRWRESELGQAVDASGGLPDGSEFLGVEGLEQALAQRPEWFAKTMVEKLMTYALGRQVEYDDAPAVRSIVREAADTNYRFSQLVLGIVNSTPFQMRSMSSAEPEAQPKSQEDLSLNR